MRRRLMIAAPLLVAAPATAAEKAARTYYDRLPLDTPGQAAGAFVAAYTSSDYWTVYQILAAETQAAIQDAFALLKLNALLAIHGFPDAKLMDDIVPNQATSEHPFDVSWMFDQLMLGAQMHGVLPIALSAGATIGPVDGEPPRVIVNGGPEPIGVQLTRSPMGRWRVLSAMPPGRDPAKLPWGLG